MKEIQNADNQATSQTIEYYIALDEFGFSVANFKHSSPWQKTFKIMAYVVLLGDMISLILNPPTWETNFLTWLGIIALALPGLGWLWQNYAYKNKSSLPNHFLYLNEDKIHWKKGLNSKLIHWAEVERITIRAELVDIYTRGRAKPYSLDFKYYVANSQATKVLDLLQMIRDLCQKLNIQLAEYPYGY
jgi:hypothetical protein